MIVQMTVMYLLHVQYYVLAAIFCEIVWPYIDMNFFSISPNERTDNYRFHTAFDIDCSAHPTRVNIILKKS